MEPSEKQPSELLREQRDTQLSVWVPFPLSQLVDDLCAALSRTSAGTVRRKELVAAVLAEVTRDPLELANLIGRYRSAPAWPGEFRREKPGPRSREV